MLEKKKIGKKSSKSSLHYYGEAHTFPRSNEALIERSLKMLTSAKTNC